MQFDFNGIEIVATDTTKLLQDIRSRFTPTPGWSLNGIQGEVYLLEVTESMNSNYSWSGFMLIDVDLPPQQIHDLVNNDHQLTGNFPTKLQRQMEQVGNPPLLVKVCAYENQLRIIKFSFTLEI